MKNLIIFLLVLFGIEQALGQQDNKHPIYPYKDGGYTKEALQDLAVSGTVKGVAFSQSVLLLSGESDVPSFFAKLTEESVTLKSGEYRNSYWDSESQQIVSFLGKDYTGKVFTYKSGEKKFFIKANCGNILTLIEKEENIALREEDYPYIPPENPQDGEGHDYFIDTEGEKVSEVPNGTTINNYYIDNNGDQSYGQCDYSYLCNAWPACFSWGLYFYPSMSMYACAFPSTQINYYNSYSNSYSYYSYYEYKEIHPQPQPNPGGGQDPPIDPQPNPGGGQDPPPSYYGPRNGTSHDGSTTVGSSRRITTSTSNQTKRGVTTGSSRSISGSSVAGSQRSTAGSSVTKTTVSQRNISGSSVAQNNSVQARESRNVSPSASAKNSRSVNSPSGNRPQTMQRSSSASSTAYRSSSMPSMRGTSGGSSMRAPVSMAGARGSR